MQTESTNMDVVEYVRANDGELPAIAEVEISCSDASYSQPKKEQRISIGQSILIFLSWLVLCAFSGTAIGFLATLIWGIGFWIWSFNWAKDL